MRNMILLVTAVFSFSLMADDFKPNYTLSIESGSQDPLSFKFMAGQVNIREVVGEKNEIRCELEPLVQPNLKGSKTVIFEVDYKKFQCEITLSSQKLNISGNSGQIQAIGLTSHSSFELQNGQIQFMRNPKIRYVFNAAVEQGMKPMIPGTFVVGGKPTDVKIRIKNGMISIL